MTDKEIKFREKKEINQIISDTFLFLKQEYKNILKMTGIYILPFIFMNALLQVHVQRKIIGKIDIYDAEAIMENFGPVYLNFFMASLFAIFVQSLLIGTFYTYLEAYIKEGKGKFSAADITPDFFSNSLQALTANLVLFLFITAGVLLCILPGIYLGNTFSILVFIYLFEKKNLGQSLHRSFRLVNIQWWNTLLINITGLAFIYFAGVILSLPTLMAGSGPDAGALQEAGTGGYNDLYWLWTGVSAAVTSLLWVVPYTFLAFQYFNLDERSKTTGL